MIVCQIINLCLYVGKFSRLSQLNPTSSTLIANKISNRIAVGCALRYQSIIFAMEDKESLETTKVTRTNKQTN